MGADLVIAVNLNHNPEIEETESKTASTEEEEDTSDNVEAREETPDQEEQDTGLIDSLTDKYESFKAVVSENVDDWIPDSQSGLSIFDVIGNSMNAMEQRVTENNLQRYQPDLLIQPDLMEFGIFDFHRAEPIMERGYEAARDMKPQIEQLIAEASE
jgi:NTE family protein